MILNTLILNRVEKFDAAPEPRSLDRKKKLLYRGEEEESWIIEKEIIIYVKSKEYPGGELKNNSYLYINCRNAI